MCTFCHCLLKNNISSRCHVFVDVHSGIKQQIIIHCGQPCLLSPNLNERLPLLPNKTVGFSVDLVFYSCKFPICKKILVNATLDWIILQCGKGMDGEKESKPKVMKSLQNSRQQFSMSRDQGCTLLIT